MSADSIPLYILPISNKKLTVRTKKCRGIDADSPDLPVWIHDEEAGIPTCGHIMKISEIQEWITKRVPHVQNQQELTFCPICEQNERLKRMTTRVVREDSEHVRKNPVPLPKIELTLQGQELPIESLPGGSGIKSIPTAAVTAPGDDTGLYIVQQWGQIWRYDLMEHTSTKFLDLSKDIQKLDPLKEMWKGMDDERGLLGLAFHPHFSDENSTYFYGVFYIVHSSKLKNPGEWNKGEESLPFEHRSKLSKLRTTGTDGRTTVKNPDPKNTLATRISILKTDQPQMNHNGGAIIFGPAVEDSRSGIGYLYYAIGDGGGANDEHGFLINEGEEKSYMGNAQDGSNHLGKILRIDVNVPYYLQEKVVREGKRIEFQMGSHYLIPEENIKQTQLMMNNNNFLPEIFMYGLRNAWRFSFDEESNRMFIADVGQFTFEEINIVDHPDPDETKMHNFGWRALEGGVKFKKENIFNHTLLQSIGGYKTTTPPKIEYNRGGKFPFAVIGGYVYRGREIPTLKGAYVFGDYNGILFFAFESAQGGQWVMKELLPSLKTAEEKESNDIVRLTSFATDKQGELYLFKVNFTKNKTGLYRLIAGDLSESEVDEILLSAEEAAESGDTVSGIRAGGTTSPRMHISVYTKSGYYKTLSMSGAWEGSSDISISKAYSASAFSSNENSLTTRTIGELSQTGPWNKPTEQFPYDGNRPPLHGIGHSNTQHGIIEFPGGLPIYHSITHELVGGIGVSGDVVDVDEEIALKGLPEKYHAPQKIRINVVSGGALRYTK